MNERICEVLKRHRKDLGKKTDHQKSERLIETKRLTELLSSGKGYSFVRLGDFDVAYLLEAENGNNGDMFHGDNNVSGTWGMGSPGLDTTQATILRRALEQADYLDLHELLWKDNALLVKLKLNRKTGTTCNPNRDTSYILPTWMEHEFKSYCLNRSILFCGAEAPLLEELLANPGFRELAKDYWPKDCKPYFLRPRDNGRNLAKNLDEIKQDLVEAIKRWNIDTLFLSLGGGAKILCFELARELGIRAIDFGACTRSLTYSGSDGNRASRSTHTVFLYRVPFRLFMDALEKSYPELSPEVLLAKAHAQLLLEVQEKEVGWSHSAWENDFSSENLVHFKDAFNVYKSRYAHLFNYSWVTKKERADFLHFCGTHKLTWEGVLFIVWFNIKSTLNIILKRF